MQSTKRAGFLVKSRLINVSKSYNGLSSKLGHKSANSVSDVGFAAFSSNATKIPLINDFTKRLPQWEETVAAARDRYVQVINALADKYPSENLLLVTHGSRCEGVVVSVSAFAKDIIVYQVEYCAYSQLRRPSSFGKDNKFTAGNFEALLHVGETGISYYTPSSAVL